MSCQGRCCAPSTQLPHSSAEREADQFARRTESTVPVGAPGPLAHLLVQPSILPTRGTPLPGEVRGDFEHHTGVDLSPVRVHELPPALAASRGGRAFSTGSDIVLPASPSHAHNHRALAHEIAHVVQHHGGGPSLSDLSSGAPGLVQGDGGMSERDMQLLRGWLATGPDTGRNPGNFVPAPGLTWTFPLPGQSTPRRTDLSRGAICNVNCHQTPEEQRREAERRAEEAHQDALRRAWPGLTASQSTPELDKQGRSIQDDIDASRSAEGQLRLRMFDAAIAAGGNSRAGGATQLDNRIRAAWASAEQAALMIDAVFRASGSDPVPSAVVDPLRMWFVAFYASVSRLFRQLDTDDKLFAGRLARMASSPPPSLTQPATACPGGCHQPAPSNQLRLGPLLDPQPVPGLPVFGLPALPTVLLDATPGPRETRLLQAAASVQEASSKPTWTTATDHFQWATDQLDQLLRRRLEATGGQADLLQNFTYAQEIRRRQQQFLLANPTAVKVPAVFFPKDEVSDRSDASGAHPAARAIPWNLYLTRTPVQDSNHVPTGFEWALHDLTATKGGERTVRTRYQITQFEAFARERLGEANVMNLDPPRSLFEELDHRDFFPAGRLYWRWPASHRDDSIETTASRPFWEWVALVGIAIVVIGSLAFAPFSTPALITFAAGTGLTLGARYLRLEEMKEHGVWTPADTNRFYWEIAQDVLAAATLGVGRVAIAAAEVGNLARAAGAARVWFALRRVEMAAHVVNVGIATADLVGRFREIRDSKTMTKEQKDQAMSQLAAQAVLTGALSIVAFQGSTDLLSGRPVLYLRPDAVNPGRFVATLSTVGARDVLAETAGLSSTRLAQRPRTLEEEFRIARSMPARAIKDDAYDTEVVLSNGHAWRRQAGGKGWCRFSDDPLCFIFGEGGGHHIETFPAERKARQGFWSGTPGNSEFTPNAAAVLRRTQGRPIVYIDGYPDLTPFAVGVVLMPRATLALRDRAAHNLYADTAFARQRGWLTTAGTPDAARVAALRADPADLLTWHHVEFDNIMLLVPRSIHEAAQHAGGYARQ